MVDDGCSMRNFELTSVAGYWGPRPPRKEGSDTRGRVSESRMKAGSLKAPFFDAVRAPAHFLGLPPDA